MLGLRRLDNRREQILPNLRGAPGQHHVAVFPTSNLGRKGRLGAATLLDDTIVGSEPLSSGIGPFSQRRCRGCPYKRTRLIDEQCLKESAACSDGYTDLGDDHPAVPIGCLCVREDHR